MPGIDFSELIVVGVLVLVFVGPERLPHITRNLGRMYGRLRAMADELRRAMTLEADRMDEEERLRALVARRKAAEEARRKATEAPEGDGTVAQPDPAVAAAAVAQQAEASIPPGFSQQEWDELPENVREIVRQRRSTA